MHYRNAIFETIHTEQKGNTFFITISNPPVNALSEDVRGDIWNMLREIEDKVPVAPSMEITEIVLRGEGNYFSAGADIKELRNLICEETPRENTGRNKGKDFSEHGQSLIEYIQRYPKKITAEIDGYALGGGLELALACHEIVATERSILGLPEVTLGLIPGWGGTINLIARSKSASYAKTMICKGMTVSAKEAFRMGIVDEISNIGNDSTLSMPPPREPAPIVEFLLTHIYFNKKFEESVKENWAFEREAETFGFVVSQYDAHEGIAAFLEKRQPNFKQIEMNIKR
ncbi:MAG: enoyl-CoA hydratase-related protein [bacterium]|nr:enoyl-CoA hydratase-related protein [bacterium]